MGNRSENGYVCGLEMTVYTANRITSVLYLHGPGSFSSIVGVLLLPMWIISASKSPLAMEPTQLTGVENSGAGKAPPLGKLFN